MTATSASTYRRTAEASWRWVLDQVRYDDDGPWIPPSVTEPAISGPSWDRDGMHSGIGGLAHTLAEARATRPWTGEELALAEQIAERVLRTIRTQTDTTFFDGLVSSIGVLVALGADGVEEAVTRLAELAGEDGWAQTALAGPRYLPGARINDLTLGSAGVLLGAVWAHRHGVAGADELASTAADILLAEAEPLPSGTN